MKIKRREIYKFLLDYANRKQSKEFGFTFYLADYTDECEELVQEALKSFGLAYSQEEWIRMWKRIRRALNCMIENGWASKYTLGNQEAKYYAQPNWNRVYTFTERLIKNWSESKDKEEFLDSIPTW